MRVHVETHGCAVTQGEAKVIEAGLLARGHAVVGEGEAEAHVLVTCTVVERTQRDMERRIAALRQAGRPLLVTGCMAKAQPEAVLAVAPEALVLPPQRVQEAPLVLERGKLLSLAPVAPARVPRRLDGVVSTHVLNDGCLGRCSFCITKVARPGLASQELRQVVADVREAVALGAVEVRLTSQDTAAWGVEQGLRLPVLLESLAALPGDFRLRVGMMNPMAAAPLMPDLLEALGAPRVFRFLHLPVQSGSDRVLAAMRRDHGAEEFLALVRAFRRRFPDLVLWTDVIVGFPGEGYADVRDTLAVLEASDPDVVHVTRFSARPGTRAAALPDQVPGRLATDWSREVVEVARQGALRRNLAWVGREAEALVTEQGQEGTVMARLDNYKLVVLPARPLGQRLRVRIVGATEHYLRGEVVG